MPAAHALLGCNTTSSMFGIGKRTVYRVLKSKSEEFSDLVLLGEGNVEDFLAVSRVCASLYDQKAKLRADYSNLNKFRVRLATKKEEASLTKLPPCEATIHRHVLRASLQTYIWKSSQKGQPPVRSPLMFGWEDKGGLVPVFFRGQMPSDFLQDLVCSCKGKSISSSSCLF